MSDTLIKVEKLYKSFGQNQVLSNISFDVKKHRSLVVMGASGTGKSVLLKIMCGLLEPTSGQVLVNNIVVNNKERQNYFNLLQKVGFLFQSGALFDSLNISDNITFFVEKLRPISAVEKKDLAAKTLKKVGLGPNILSLYPKELSGGMQKRVGLARAICHNPEIIFFDEPTTGLDPIMSNLINSLIRQVRENLNVTTITITHDMNSVRQIADDIILLHKGSIVWQGERKNIDNANNPYLHQFVMGLSEGPIQAF